MPTNRRIFLKRAALSFAAAPLLPVLLHRDLAYAAPEILALDNPTAKALSYVHDASKADPSKKVARGGVEPDKQLCSNCMFIQGEVQTVAGQEGKWVGCQLFPAKLVNNDGWCASWQPKP